MTNQDNATLDRPTKIFFPKKAEDAGASKPRDVELDMGEASRLEGFRQNGCR